MIRSVPDLSISLEKVFFIVAKARQSGGSKDLRAEASRAHNNRTASYLTGTPMFADYLEEALSQFGKSFEDFEQPL